MEVGVFIPHLGPLASPSFVPTFCRHAEAAGFDGLWTAEHLAAPRAMSSTYTLRSQPVMVDSAALRATMGLNLEATTTLATAAAVTNHVRLGTSVAVLPLHHRILNARQLASIDLYSGDRLVYGVGVGWLQEEARATGVPWKDRGARSEEHLAVLRTLRTAAGDTVDFDGDYFTFPPIDPNPVPTQSIPILVGGHSGVALDRAARLGDGWIASNMGPERLAAAIAQLHKACENHARSIAELWLVCSTNVRVDDTEELSGVAAKLHQFKMLGVAHVQIRFKASSAQSLLNTLDQWGNDILPTVREDELRAQQHACSSTWQNPHGWTPARS